MEKNLKKKEKKHNEIEELKKQNKELNEKYIRLYAEFDNYRKRTQKEMIDQVAYANEKFIVKLLAVIDNFELALSSCKEDVKKTPFYDGLILILNHLMDVLEKEGITSIKTRGEKFNPHHHEAVEIIEDGKTKEEIIEVQKGYTYKDKVIRAAKVKVVK